MPASLGGVHPEPAAGERPLTAAQIRQAKKEAQQAITEVIDRAISALGFEKKPWPGVRGPGQGLYIRQINPETLGLVRWYDLSGSGCNIPDVTVWIGVRSQPLEKALAEERGEKFHPYWGPSMEVEIGTLMGITQRWYKFKEVEKDAEVAEQIAAEVRDYAIPFMEAHASLAALATKAGQPCFYWERPKEERARIAHLLMATDERAPQV